MFCLLAFFLVVSLLLMKLGLHLFIGRETQPSS